MQWKQTDSNTWQTPEGYEVQKARFENNRIAFGAFSPSGRLIGAWGERENACMNSDLHKLKMDNLAALRAGDEAEV